MSHLCCVFAALQVFNVHHLAVLNGSVLVASAKRRKYQFFTLTLPLICACCCQGNPSWLTNRKQDLLAIYPPLPGPLFLFLQPSLFFLREPLPSFHPFSSQLDRNKKVLVFHWYVRQCLLFSGHLSIKCSLPESVWFLWPRETSQTNPGFTVITRSFSKGCNGLDTFIMTECLEK